mgnify:CR=1 FL=1
MTTKCAAQAFACLTRPVQPRWLELEVLETSALEDIGHASGLFAACSELGVSFALDDSIARGDRIQQMLRGGEPSQGE